MQRLVSWGWPRVSHGNHAGVDSYARQHHGGACPAHSTFAVLRLCNQHRQSCALLPDIAMPHVTEKVHLVWARLGPGMGLRPLIQATSFCTSAGRVAMMPLNLTGTSAYNSPEAVRNAPLEYLDACAQDMWAAGVLAVALFASFLPFADNSLPGEEPDWQGLCCQHNDWVCCTSTGLPSAAVLVISCCDCHQLQCCCMHVVLAMSCNVCCSSLKSAALKCTALKACWAV